MNYFELELKAISENEKFARNVVATFVIPLNPTVSELDDIKTAVSEAVTNCIVHGYDYKTDKPIHIRAEIIDNCIKIIIRDYGSGIENIEQAMQPFYTTRANDDRSGMGFTVMQSFMDSISVESKVGEGTTVTMTRKIINDYVEVVNA